jgi:hypothetical protein
MAVVKHGKDMTCSACGRAELIANIVQSTEIQQRIDKHHETDVGGSRIKMYSAAPAQSPAQIHHC